MARSGLGGPAVAVAMAVAVALALSLTGCGALDAHASGGATVTPPAAATPAAPSSAAPSAATASTATPSAATLADIASDLGAAGTANNEADSNAASGDQAAAQNDNG
jgi:hypothetical protein